ncbi:hypothetical protein WICPIJ_007841 [Wickerhamomyces pijperi]|uniref:Uncharacterized protein n=1 Tax=Wickerhamomyces pijperi TaxID=599730 RepID=A0A9P8PZH9_WICPI|nr:hypothetical protein WICPIJ_007841 [Wickerhamomyces pijperi]
MDLSLANLINSSLFKPFGSANTPEPSTIPTYTSFGVDNKISLEPKSPSGPPVWNFKIGCSDKPWTL